MVSLMSRATGGSIITASAPQSASWRTAVGPARARVRSSTLMPASGSGSAMAPTFSGRGVEDLGRLEGGDRGHRPAIGFDIHQAAMGAGALAQARGALVQGQDIGIAMLAE